MPNKRSRNRPQVHFTCDREVLEWLDAKSEALRKPRSAIIEDIINEARKREESQ